MNYMTAKKAIELSTKSLIDEYPEECKRELIEMIERTAMAGERSVIIAGDVKTVGPYIKPGYRQFLESLGYNVKFDSRVDDIGLNKLVLVQYIKISW